MYSVVTFFVMVIFAILHIANAQYLYPHLRNKTLENLVDCEAIQGFWLKHTLGHTWSIHVHKALFHLALYSS